MKNILKFVFVASCLFVSACDHGVEDMNEPSVETLAEEQKTAPKTEDGKIVAGGLLAKSTDFECLGDRTQEDVSHLGYEIVIEINKAPGAQTLEVYQRGTNVYSWVTSTGVERDKIDKQGRKSSTVTPVGFFTPIQGRLYENYFSRSWQADMPYAVFFVGGVAIHATGSSNYKHLGKRASGGCVRLKYDQAKTLFNLIKNDVGMGQVAQVNRNGCLAKDSNGQVIYKKGYRTLIVVHDDGIYDNYN